MAVPDFFNLSVLILSLLGLYPPVDASPDKPDKNSGKRNGQHFRPIVITTAVGIAGHFIDAVNRAPKYNRYDKRHKQPIAFPDYDHIG